MKVEVAFGQDLEEGFSIEIDLIKLFVCLIVNVAVCETEVRRKWYPFAIIRPWGIFYFLMLTP